MANTQCTAVVGVAAILLTYFSGGELEVADMLYGKATNSTVSSVFAPLVHIAAPIF